MTREECITLLERYAEYDGMGIPNLTGCREAMKMAADLLSQPSLPSNLDKAAEEYADYNSQRWFEGGDIYYDHSKIMDAFKAGAECVLGYEVKAHCIESCNPVSNSPDKKFHCITLLYEENENTPHVLGGDDIEIILRKKQQL